MGEHVAAAAPSVAPSPSRVPPPSPNAKAGLSGIRRAEGGRLSGDSGAFAIHRLLLRPTVGRLLCGCPAPAFRGPSLSRRNPGESNLIAKNQAIAELVHVDDEVLMARFAAGHAEAFEALYDRYEIPLFGFCLRVFSRINEFQITVVDVWPQSWNVERKGNVTGHCRQGDTQSCNGEKSYEKQPLKHGATGQGRHNHSPSQEKCRAI